MLIIALISLTFNLTSAQTLFPYDVSIPQILPSSPEATAFVKAGVGNSNLSSGAATANIPLYTIKLKDFSFPLSISYSTQGLKADEASSRVGYGWVLNATGMITRSVKGVPDEFGLKTSPPADFPAVDDRNTNLLYNYYLNVTNPALGIDTQADEFQFSVGGYSGKFILDNSYHPLSTTTGNVKITAQVNPSPGSTSGSINNFYLTTPDGVKYTFGTNYEITTGLNGIKYDYYKLVTRTAFFLDRIDLPTGEYIVFNYTSIHYDVNMGAEESITYINGGYCGNGSGGAYVTQNNRVSYDTKYLTGISVSNGITINFTYGSTGTLMNDVRLTGLEIVGQKKFDFQYYDVAHTLTTPMPRFFLTALRDITDAAHPLVHSFTYDRMNQVPLPISFEQDYLGFYNGNGRGYLIPPFKNSNGVMDFSFREPDADKTMMGTLTKIQYPTGGREEFFYEGNTTKELKPVYTMSNQELLGPGGGSSGSSSPLVYTKTITIPFTQDVTLSCYAEDALPDDGYTADPSHHTVSVWIYNGGTMVASRSSLGYSTSSNTVTLQSGTYLFKMEVESYTEEGHGSVTFNTSPRPLYDTVNSAIPGVRLRQIRYTDPFTATTHSRYFTYATLSDLRHSTGGCSYPGFASSTTVRTYPQGEPPISHDCNTEVYSSNSSNLVYTLSSSGSPIYYTTVIESDDPDFLNGGTEYTFYPLDDGNNKQMLKGTDIPYLSGGHYPTLTGTLQLKKIFDRTKTIVQTEQDDYETLIDLSNYPTSIYVRKDFTPLDDDPGRLDAFDVAQWYFGSYWNRIKTKTITSYAGGTAYTQRTDYFYGTTVNVQPDSVITTDSKGVTLLHMMRYPNTYAVTGDPALAGYSSLTAKNIVAPVVYETSYRNGVQMQEKKTLYKDWFGNSAVISPEKVQLRESYSDGLHDVLVYKQYDANGNPVHLQKVNDFFLTYIWDNVFETPIAEIKSASPNQVAFTSFENNALGNWSITSGGIIASAPFTGSNSFTGTLQRTVTMTGTINYFVMLWTSSATAPSVNGTSGTVVRTSNGFNLYQWRIPVTNSGTITVTGTQIDEVRLFPEGSQMQTLTYKPFIGPATTTDANNRPTFYSYDSNNRLQAVKDQDGNVVKTIEYHYQNQ